MQLPAVWSFAVTVLNTATFNNRCNDSSPLLHIFFKNSNQSQEKSKYDPLQKIPDMI